MASNKHDVSPLWPGYISLKPYDTVYQGVYRGEAMEFQTYKEAEEWVLQQKEKELKKNNAL